MTDEERVLNNCFLSHSRNLSLKINPCNDFSSCADRQANQQTNQRKNITSLADTDLQKQCAKYVQN